MNADAIQVESETTAPDWSELNQRWLVREMGRLATCVEAVTSDAPRVADADAAIEVDVAEPVGADRVRPAGAAGDDFEYPTPGFVPALHRLAALFGLSSFERDVLLMAAGFELDANLRKVITHASGVARRPTFAVALEALASAHWDAMSPQAPLRYWRLLFVEPSSTLTDAGLRIDERILNEIIGVADFDPRLHGVVRRPAAASAERSLDTAWLARRFAHALNASSDHASLLLLTDADGEWREAAANESLAATAFAEAGFNSLVVELRDLPSDPRELAETVRLLDREAALTTSVVMVRVGSAGEHAHEHELRLASFVQQSRSHIALLGPVSRDLLAMIPRQHVYRAVLPAITGTAGSSTRAPSLERALRKALQQFRLSPAQINGVLGAVEIDAAHTSEAALDAAVWRAARETARGGLEALAQRIDSRTTFEDVVLPPQQMALLREVTCQLRHRDRVYRDWGFAAGSLRGLGLAALFTGESGTGKTMAAEAIANEVGLDLYRIDLAVVVSKYIGETEKNLRRVFDAAEASGAVLLFDEAEALFGKRSEVKDSHDRYANIEVAYLLQRIDAYRGLAILTTNMKSALDRAFLRRLRFVVHFPFPDPSARERIWRKQFPAAAPLGAIDFAALARLQMAGGNIRSIAVNAAFKAAECGTPIDQAAVVAAAQAEYLKLDRNPADLGGKLE